MICTYVGKYSTKEAMNHGHFYGAMRHFSKGVLLYGAMKSLKTKTRYISGGVEWGGFAVLLILYPLLVQIMQSVTVLFQILHVLFPLKHFQIRIFFLQKSNVCDCFFCFHIL